MKKLTFMNIEIVQWLKILFILVIIFFIVSSRGFLPKSTQQLGVSDSVQDTANVVFNYCRDNANVSGGKESCYSSKFKEVAEERGPEFSFQALDVLQKIDSSAIGCHLISHGIGKGSYKGDPNNWRTLVQNMPSICNYGAIHGVLESYIGSLPDKSLKKDVIPTICGDRPRADCNHIVGHLLLVETDADVNKALDLCEVLKEVPENSFCISGVFMEYQTALNLVTHKLVPESWLNWPVRLGELEKLCRSYDGKYAEGCWEEIVHVALVKFNNDPKKIFDFCSTAQVPNGANRCKRHSIGIMGASKNFNLKALKSVCSFPQQDNPNFQKECYPALISSSLSTIPKAVPEAVAFCASLDNEFKQSCFSMVGVMGLSNQIIKNQLPSACRSVPDDLQKYCLGVSFVDQGQLLQRSND